MKEGEEWRERERERLWGAYSQKTGQIRREGDIYIEREGGRDRETEQSGEGY